MKTRKSRINAWSEDEKVILRRVYPADGVEGCLPLLPNRSPHAIYMQAFKLCIHSQHRGGSKSARAVHDELDIQILAAWPDVPTKSTLAEIAATLDQPLWLIRERARAQLLTTRRGTSQQWTEEENAILRAGPLLDLMAISASLAALGTERTIGAIRHQARRLGLPIVQPGLYSARQAALILGIHTEEVAGLTTSGLLPASRRPLANAGPGLRQYLVEASDLRTFITDHPQWVNFQRADKYELIALLAEKPKKEDLADAA